MRYNRDVYLKDPGQTELLNNGVAKVVEDLTPQERRTLRYELETFVCEGEYERGVDNVLNTFLRNLNQSEQPGVWVSGFFGSGKSHLVKMLRALWMNTPFPEDHTTAREIAGLPVAISDALRELSTAGKREGGLHAASGTLGAGLANRVRPALLAIIFRSVELPSAYPQASFILWLKREGHLDAIKSFVEKNGRNWQTELNNMYVSTPIAEALVQIVPDFANNPLEARKQLREQYRNTDDVTNEQMVQAIREALVSHYGRFPLTLVALDEVQQYIGEDADRTYQVQEAVETCCKKFGARLMFVGTGQTALSGTPSLQRLMGRFQVRVELSDTDVDAVVRKIILAKKPEAVATLKKMTEDNMGEISRHLVGTKLGHRPEDMEVLVADYPLLPVRRRFWERVLRAVDPTGTKSQLRNQINVVHEAARQTADAELGCVVGSDFIFDQIATELLQTGELAREIFERIQKLKAGDDTQQLQARLGALIYLIGKLRDGDPDLGVRATEQMLADLMIEDLRQGSGALRQKIPALLQDLVDSGMVMRIDDEYRLQTREGAAWNDEYRRQYNAIQNDAGRIATERVELFRSKVREQLNNIRIPQGRSKELRKPELHFGMEPPSDPDGQICVWVRDGWDSDENSVLSEARAAGNQSPLIFVFLRRQTADSLKSALISLHAAERTLDDRGVPTTPEGAEARNAMLTQKRDAEEKLKSVVNEIIDQAVIYQAGGQEIGGSTLANKVEEAVRNALSRFYPKFDLADHENWHTAIQRAKGGAGDALSAVGYSGNVEEHNVCKALLRFIGAGKKGSEIRAEFSNSPCGWPQDAIDGGLYVLTASGHLRATDAQGQNIDLKRLPRGQIGKTNFRVESVTVTAPQKIKVRKLLQELRLPANPGEEISSAEKVLQTLYDLADAAGGDPPLPERPRLDSRPLQNLENLLGNELLVQLAERHEELAAHAQKWHERKQSIDKRWPSWQTVLQIWEFAKDLPEAEVYNDRLKAIHAQRLLLQNPDPVQPLCDDLCRLLRTQLKQHHDQYDMQRRSELQQLSEDGAWQQLNEEQRDKLLREHGLHESPPMDSGSEKELISALKAMPLSGWRDRIEALPERFSRMRLAVAKLHDAAATRITLPSRTLHNQTEADEWLKEVQEVIKKGLEKGPIVV